MKRTFVTASLLSTLALAIAAGPGLASGATAPNQGNPAMVIKVDNPNVSCADPKPGPKKEGDFGRTIWLHWSKPIDFVTVKSGKGAYVVKAWFDTFKGKITLSKDVSNFVVWTCPKG